MGRWRMVTLGIALAAVGCGEGGSTLSPEAEVGRSVYMSNCTACHAVNPNQDGVLGPPVAGASKALLEARVVHGNYPPGYTPMRDTNVMVALPHLADKIDDLYAYLQAVKK